MENKMRKVFRIENDGIKQIDFMELKTGDIFSMFEPTGESVTFKQNPKLEALSDAYINDAGVGEIHLKDYDPVLH